MFSILVFMCRDPGDTTSKVSCCVEPSQCFEDSDFDASVRMPLHSIENELARKQNYGKSQKWLFCRNFAFTQRFDSYTFTNKALIAFCPELHFKSTTGC